MLQRGLGAIVVCVLFSFSAFGQASLTIPSEVLGAPNSRAEGSGNVTLGAPGLYMFSYEPADSSVIATLQVNKPFQYSSTAPFKMSVFLSGCAQKTFTLTFRNILEQVVVNKTVTFKCFQPKAELSFPNALKGSGTTADPARFCGASRPVRINGSGSATTSTYEIEVRDLKDNVTTKRALTAAEAASIGNFDLQKVVAPSFFKGGRSYSVTLATIPVRAEVTKTIAFDAATPRFRMTDRNGRVFDGGNLNEPVVICPGKMLLDGGGSSCESSYFIGVEESDANWSALKTPGWSRWFDFREAPDGIDLDTLIAQNPKGLTPGSTTFTLEPLYQFGVLKPAPRYFRIAFATGEPAWDVRHLFVRTGTRDECGQPIGKDVFANNACPRTDKVTWGEPLSDELKRLIFAPCTYSRVPCLNQSERQRVPEITPGPHQALVTAWQGKVYAAGGVDLATQDSMVSAIRAKAAEKAPVCAATGEKKVPIDFEFELDYVAAGHRVHMRVWYACCGKLF